ncbi:MAG: hypothetical protein ACI9LU_002902 [Polaribacter sp.]|jgi:hypothetical protein
MQVVYLSNRPTIFAETLRHVALFMPFIKGIVVCVPETQKQGFQAIVSNIPIQVVVEGILLNNDEASNLSNLDHQRRNYLLRSRLIQSDKVDAEFIMSDDDSRPLKPITLDTFIKNDRYRRYFFYDLASWNNNQTDFDAGQIATCAVLDHENLEHLSYASHMPQVIDKELFIETQSFFSAHAMSYPLCEWSTYFNYAPSLSPERFHPPEAFKTLCWPEHPLAWKYYIKPANSMFENYTPSLYQNNEIFKDFTTTAESHSQIAESHSQIVQTNIEKIILWKRYTISCLHPEQAKGLAKYFRFRTWANKLFMNQ